MKKLLSVLCLASSAAFAGTADIPNWQTSPYEYSCFRVSNTSNVDAEVTVKFYDQNGTLYSGPIIDKVFIAALNTPFVVPPQGTGRFCLNMTSSLNIGYGTIEAHAAAPSTGQVRMIAQGFYQVVASDRMSYAIQINNGMPF